MSPVFFARYLSCTSTSFSLVFLNRVMVCWSFTFNISRPPAPSSAVTEAVKTNVVFTSLPVTGITTESTFVPTSAVSPALFPAEASNAGLKVMVKAFLSSLSENWILLELWNTGLSP